ncbi:MAG: sigma-54-dependent Fis family transcriptional regulator [Candidatus Parabeggiatoa sp. nov. 3]|nr:MAG: sigma-54-dependent Fis family transcriptional regulator [Gammaproteobacteria bacterium]RKZ68157.1 MAG: sigma-54-dependent Fis family transcriptional regulator [Gammaproteobacteria bacterium]RKZ80842.1 MAG: sigma-54-dependent Fis family transcriptional regulator [Gammaproteobacteria bacterium]
MNPSCLVVDDEPDILDLLVMTLQPMNIDCYTAQNMAQAQTYLQSQEFDLCLTDMRLPDGNGLDLVETINQNHSQMPVAVITAYGNIETAVQAVKVGAFDFISKPLKITQLRNLVTNALQLPKQQQTGVVKKETKETIPNQPIDADDEMLSNLIGHSEAMQMVRAKIKKLARSQAPIYIKGESGTGKEVVARMLHALGSRANKPFVPVNCGAIPTELMESEFFGHKKGSFSGAYNDKEGLFQTADGGTLFLDEVADLPLSMQVKLLRAIQAKQIRPIGAPKEIPVDVRILSATHRNLSLLVKKNQFRHDLFYRINVIEFSIPPLRERPEDIPALAHHILKRLIPDKKRQVQQPHISERAMKALNDYLFPGNVRELENILERAITLCENNTIKPEDLQLPAHVEIPNSGTLDPLLEDVEKETILNALEQTQGNRKEAAKLLGIGIGALRYRLHKFHVFG